MPSMVWTIISFIIIFSVVVIAHEFGHFLIARQNGIQVNEFAIGMGPVIYKKVFGTTRFVIRLLPIGGACIFEGEDGNYEGEEEQEKHDEIAIFQEYYDETILGKYFPEYTEQICFFPDDQFGDHTHFNHEWRERKKLDEKIKLMQEKTGYFKDLKFE